MSVSPTSAATSSTRATQPRTRTILHWTYLEIAQSALESSHRAERLEKMCRERSGRAAGGGAGAVNDEELHWAEIASGHEKSGQAIVAIIFSALTLEAYANSIAHQRLSHLYRNTLDKLDLPGKWIVIPKMAFGEGLDPAGEVIGRIRRLHKERNALIHTHPAFLHGPGMDDPASLAFWKEAFAHHHVRPEKADAAVQTCLDAVAAVLKIAPDFDPDFAAHARGRESARRRMAAAAKKIGLECEEDEQDGR